MRPTKELLEAIARADTDDALVRKLALGTVLALVVDDIAPALKDVREKQPRLHVVRDER